MTDTPIRLNGGYNANVEEAGSFTSGKMKNITDEAMDYTLTVGSTAVTVRGADDVTEKEIREYMSLIRKECPKEEIVELLITVSGDKVALDPILKPPKFHRIRRITGYLVGSMERWNNAKTAEEHDRVKHCGCI